MPIDKVDVMIDLETFDNRSRSGFITIGACIFDRMTGDIKDTFYRKIDRKEIAKYKRTVSADTMKWWMAQDDKAWDEVMKSGGTSLKAALEDLSKFIPPNALVWGNGATFDITILETAYEDLGMKEPWKFWNVRDVRTVVDLAEGLVEKPKTVTTGTAHNAVDDAVHQAKYVAEMISALKKAGGK